MEENKINESAETNNNCKKVKKIGVKKLKNQALFRRGGYSVAVTALFLVGVILFNCLVSALADRFNLEFDMSSTRQNTISAKNLKFIKDMDTDVSIIFCAKKDEYASGMMSSYASYYYQVSDNNETQYYNQTIRLVEKYADTNKKITVDFVDTQSSKFAEIASKYSNESIAYGDIIVSAEIAAEDGSKTARHKIISYTDIYTLSDDTGYAAMGYGGYTIGGNNIETQLTSAISIVTSTDAKKILFLTGHSSGNYTESYKNLLEANGYEVTENGDALITSISNEYDALAIMAPSRDFLAGELDKIEEFLNNGEALGKGLLYFADAVSPTLPNFTEFLLDWGIESGEGILFETNAANRMDLDPYTMGTFPAEDEITSGMAGCVTKYNVPLTASEPADNRIGVTTLMTTLESVVVAPKGADKAWKDYKESDMGAYSSVIQAEKTDTNQYDEEISSYIIAFSSVEFIYSEWAEYDALSNKNITLAATDRASGLDNTGISFVPKIIVNESFAESVSEDDIAVIRIIFMILLPVAVAALGVVIFIRRKNA